MLCWLFWCLFLSTTTAPTAAVAAAPSTRLFTKLEDWTVSCLRGPSGLRYFNLDSASRRPEAASTAQELKVICKYALGRLKHFVDYACTGAEYPEHDVAGNSVGLVKGGVLLGLPCIPSQRVRIRGLQAGIWVPDIVHRCFLASGAPKPSHSGPRLPGGLVSELPSAPALLLCAQKPHPCQCTPATVGTGMECPPLQPSCSGRQRACSGHHCTV